jgi:hypothetical protein
VGLGLQDKAPEHTPRQVLADAQKSVEEAFTGMVGGAGASRRRRRCTTPPDAAAGAGRTDAFSVHTCVHPRAARLRGRRRRRCTGLGSWTVFGEDVPPGRELTT